MRREADQQLSGPFVHRLRFPASATGVLIRAAKPADDPCSETGRRDQ